MIPKLRVDGCNLLLFTIELHKRDIALLEMVRNTLGGVPCSLLLSCLRCLRSEEEEKRRQERRRNDAPLVGNISKERKNVVQYRVASLRDLTNIVIPHFDKYPLIT